MKKRQNYLYKILPSVLAILGLFLLFFIIFKSREKNENINLNIKTGLETKISKNDKSQPEIILVSSETGKSTETASMKMEVTAGNIIEDEDKTIFSDIQPNTDAVYNRIENGIKEDIILSEKPTSQPTYNFIIDSEGMAIQFFEGQFYFFDKEGYARLTIPKPFMVDADGQRSENVSISVEKSGSRYKSTVVPDFDWLTSPDRKYPVSIDPSIIIPDRSLREITERRTISSKTYDLGNGKYAATSGMEAIHYQDGNGNWQDKDTTIVPSNDPEYDFMNVTNNFQVYFSTDGFGNKKAVKFQVEDSWMKFNLIGASGPGEKNMVDENIFTFEQTYKEGDNVMDATYTLSDTQLLEEIVLNQFQGFPEIKQEIELHNAYFKEFEGTILAFKQGTEDLLWIIPKPVMYELNNKEIRNYGLHYEIQNLDENIIILSKVLDQEGKDWLSDSSRNYPLVIDTTAGPSSSGTVIDDPSTGTLAWSNPNNSLSSDDQYVTVSTTAVGYIYSHYLKFTNFSFSIPTDAGIDNITGEIEVMSSTSDSASNASDTFVNIVKSDGTFGSNYNASGLYGWYPVVDTYRSYGGVNLWYELWSASDINDPDFGMALSSKIYHVQTAPGFTIYVDHARITVYYTLSSALYDGPHSPGSVISDTSVGSVSWSSIGSSTASDNSYASAITSSQSGVYTYYIKATNFGFTIPTSALINGIKVQLERKSDQNNGGEIMTNSVRDNSIKLVKSDGSLGSVSRADTSAQTASYWTTTEKTTSFGNSYDLWGDTWTATDINDPDFGVAVSARLVAYVGQCLSPNTLIDTISGEKRIDEINVGDKVLTYDETQHTFNYNNVTNVWSSPILNREYYRISYNGGNYVEATEDHEFFLSGTYVEAKNLKVGDRLLSVDNKELMVEKVDLIQNATNNVWDLTVDNNHNFFANGVLVHNTTAYVDHIQITVYYTEGETPASPAILMKGLMMKGLKFR